MKMILILALVAGVATAEEVRYVVKPVSVVQGDTLRGFPIGTKVKVVVDGFDKTMVELSDGSTLFLPTDSLSRDKVDAPVVTRVMPTPTPTPVPVPSPEEENRVASVDAARAQNAARVIAFYERQISDLKEQIEKSVNGAKGRGMVKSGSKKDSPENKLRAAQIEALERKIELERRFISMN